MPGLFLSSEIQHHLTQTHTSVCILLANFIKSVIQHHMVFRTHTSRLLTAQHFWQPYMFSSKYKFCKHYNLLEKQVKHSEIWFVVILYIVLLLSPSSILFCYRNWKNLYQHWYDVEKGKNLQILYLLSLCSFVIWSFFCSVWMMEEW